jgi:hypothetical protein
MSDDHRAPLRALPLTSPTSAVVTDAAPRHRLGALPPVMITVIRKAGWIDIAIGVVAVVCVPAISALLAALGEPYSVQVWDTWPSLAFSLAYNVQTLGFLLIPIGVALLVFGHVARITPTDTDASEDEAAQ